MGKKKIKLAALSMLHKAKKAYYACDVIRYPLSIAWRRVRVARYTHPVYSPSDSCHSYVTSLPPLYRTGWAVHFSLFSRVTLTDEVSGQA